MVRRVGIGSISVRIAQLLSPRFGDGVDIVVGCGRTDAGAAFAGRGTTAERAFAAAGYRYGSDPALLRTAVGWRRDPA